MTGYSCLRVGTTTTCSSGAPTSANRAAPREETGGTGGSGGQGGGGNGGDSYCYYQGTGATIVAGACTPGSAGVAAATRARPTRHRTAILGTCPEGASAKRPHVTRKVTA